jgi:MFS family permease
MSDNFINSISTTCAQGEDSFSIVTLLPIALVVFVGYLVIGLALPVLPLYVHQRLGCSAFVVGIVVGGQFAMSLFTRVWAGHHVDTRGARQAVAIGLLLAVVSGLFYLLSLRFIGMSGISVAIILLGRALLGAGESFLMTGALNWGIALMGPENTSKVMAWIGSALFAALAIGAPVGSVLYAHYGFLAIALFATLIPLLTLPLIAPVRSVALPHRSQDVSTKLTSAIWLPGIGLALSGVGYGAISTFIVLYFSANRWAPTWLPLSVMSMAFIAGRLMFGHLADSIGGARVVLVCVAIETVGQLFIWLTHSPLLALIGIAMTGLSFSLVYPGLGAEVVRRVPAQNRGLAMGTYTAFSDLSLGLTGPVLGLIATGANLRAIFLVSTLVVLCATFATIRLASIPLPESA